MLKVVLLNDTSYNHHHGCNITIRVLKTKLKENGMEVIYSNPIGTDWNKKSILKKIKNADIIVINGEGTIHHNHGFNLLSITNFSSKHNIPTVLINYVFQGNTNKIFSKYLKQMKLISARESNSLREFQKFNVPCLLVPDLTFGISRKFSLKRENYSFGDSVNPTYSKTLKISSTKIKNGQYLPVETPFYKIIPPLSPVSYYLILSKKLYKNKHLTFSENKYFKKIASSKIMITGRFHSLCFAIQTRTPFLTFKSNSHKIEGLLKDVGIKNREILIENLNSSNLDQYTKFSKEELKNIEEYLDKAQKDIDNLFKKIKKIAQKNN